MEISNDKWARLHSKQSGHGFERETLREKLNIFK